MKQVALRPTGRFAELRLLVLVALLLVLGYVAVVAAARETFTATPIVVPLTFLALAAALHAFLVARGVRGDQLLLPLSLALTAIGLVEVQRLAPERLAVQQLTWCVIAAGAFAATMLIPRDLTVLSRYKYTWAFLGVLLLLSPLLPGIGREVNGARIWIGLGNVVQFQPSEAVKILLVVFFAAYLEEHREMLSSPPRRFGPIPVPPVPYLVPIIGMWAVAMVVMVAEKDLGATLLFFGIFLAMLYLATGEAFYTLMGLVLLLAGGAVAHGTFGHVAARIDTWLDPFAEELRFGAGYQLVQGLFALGNAGLLGAGLGNGMPERIPVVWSDFVFNAFTEETGFVGGLALLALYLVFVYRGMVIALRAPTPFLSLLAAGLSFVVALQTLVIVGGDLKLIPLTGVTLPFVSYGGSSLVTNFMLTALLLRISDATARVRGAP
ncbi:MAG TPA: FtsW/RodA/SpoVE family cell cycle protein [Candidatus Limnocylindria bacterium]|nr:FtsW/RodA/SpoVE family cell cycle protein [Candidatus Limnocylindria bacterium]